VAPVLTEIIALKTKGVKVSLCAQDQILQTPLTPVLVHGAGLGSLSISNRFHRVKLTKVTIVNKVDKRTKCSGRQTQGALRKHW
jgi:hypothetical protein